MGALGTWPLVLWVVPILIRVGGFSIAALLSLFTWTKLVFYINVKNCIIPHVKNSMRLL